MAHIQQSAMQLVTRAYNERERNPQRWEEVREVLGLPDHEEASADPLVKEIRDGFARLETLLERLIHAYDQNRQGRLRPRPERHAT